MKQYPLPVHAMDEVDKEINFMLESGIISKSTSPYASPITVVMKKDGAIRLCLDFRKLNKITIFDAQPIPTLDELLRKMKGAKFFTKYDLTKGYWQIPMDEDSKTYTAFQTTQGLMEFNYMPFGLSTAACTFQRAMLDTLGKLPFVVSYFDDVLIFSKSWEEHLEHIEKTLSALREAGFTVKPSKTIEGCEHINFLGHIVGEGQLKPDENKTEKIRNLKVPTTKKEVRSVLGLPNYYRRFVHNFSAIAQPLTEVMKKSSPNKIVWTPECQESWDAIKKCLTSEPILKVPDPSKPFVVQTDASNKAIAGTFLQQHEGTLHPCFYASRILKDRERNYAIIELEMLAIIFALDKFSKYLLMKPFLIQTDHAPLSFLKENKSKNARLIRWALAIQQYSFSVQHIKGSNNVLSDTLSRMT
ncbi:Pol polyprotein [Plakobranchus ocellatus]|uniref:Pol polyprotein n=1 Tax=Plakobranchus ocellatus TaxID=259542 RepID=A0AAV4BEQ2_9GAST|nr:Pol polyprotein [Plakobranchus ocellatus]